MARLIVLMVQTRTAEEEKAFSYVTTVRKYLLLGRTMARLIVQMDLTRMMVQWKAQRNLKG